MRTFIKIGTVFCIALLSLPVMLIQAQGTEFIASAKPVVREGEQFRLTYTLNKNGSDFKGPGLRDFAILSGPSQSSNRSYQIINGAVTQSFQLTFTYFLQALEEGEYKIEPATITVDGERIESNPLTIKVRKGNPPATRQQGTQNNVSSSKQIGEDDVFIKAMVDKRDPFQGEQVIITYKIYTTVPISQIDIKKLSSFPGFWYKDLKDNNQSLRQYNEVINGREYIVADLRKIALFPQRSGEITIEEMELECMAQVQGRSSSRLRDPFFDSFFDDPFFNRQNIPLRISSNSIELNVRPLPSENRPLAFNGAVGSFSMNAAIDRSEVKTNEAINLKVDISGRGNIELISEPDFVFPPDFEVYDPRVSDRINRTSSGISGRKTYEFLIIPRTAGEFTIMPTSFVYFDPATKKYVILKTPEFNLSVQKSDEGASGIGYSGVSQKDVQFIGSDIRHIRAYPFQLNKIGVHFYGSRLFYLLLTAPVIIFFAILIIWRRRVRRRKDVRLMRTKRATRVAKRNLRMGKKHLTEGKEQLFYEEVSGALWGYLSDKFNIPLSELSMDNVKNSLKDKGVAENTINEFVNVLNDCEFARFAPGSAAEKMNELYNKALDIITKTEREIK
jgi:uncharacterized membrane protein